MEIRDLLGDPICPLRRIVPTEMLQEVAQKVAAAS
jgi:hypothetical protein